MSIRLNLNPLDLRMWGRLVGALTCLVLVQVGTAGEFSISPALTDDASTGISTSKTYTHAISGGTAATINGVSLSVLNDTTTPANFTWDPGDRTKNIIACCNNGDWQPAAGGVTGADLITLLGSFTYSGNGANSPSAQTFTLSGLTPGTQYDTRLYIRTWDTEASGRPINLTFTNGAEVNTTAVMEDRPNIVGLPAVHSAYYLSYAFTAQGSDLAINAAVDAAGGANSGSFHLYALTNEVVPEPGSLVLAAMGLMGLWAVRRRS
jgi:hypothetical protein